MEKALNIIPSDVVSVFILAYTTNMQHREDLNLHLFYGLDRVIREVEQMILPIVNQHVGATICISFYIEYEDLVLFPNESVIESSTVSSPPSVVTVPVSEWLGRQMAVLTAKLRRFDSGGLVLGGIESFCIFKH